MRRVTKWVPWGQRYSTESKTTEPGLSNAAGLLLLALPEFIRTVAEPTSHHRVILQVRVGFGEFVELRLVVQTRIGDDKTADLFGGVSFDVGDSVNFRQIASHGGGAAASRHIRNTQRHKNSIDGFFGCRRIRKRIRRDGS